MQHNIVQRTETPTKPRAKSGYLCDRLHRGIGWRAAIALLCVMLGGPMLVQPATNSARFAVADAGSVETLPSVHQASIVDDIIDVIDDIIDDLTGDGGDDDGEPGGNP